MRTEDRQRRFRSHRMRQRAGPQFKTHRGLMLAGMAAIYASTALAGGGSWTSSIGGTWQTGSNWSSNAAPLSSDNVSFDLGAIYTVTFNSNGVAQNISQTTGSIVFDLNAKTLTSTGGTLQVGYLSGNNGSLTITDGSLTLGGSGASGVGRASGARGYLAIDSATLTLNNGSEFDVGDLGTGTLLITNSGKFISSATVVAGYHGANGWLEVQGANSLLSTNGFIDIGDGGGGGNGTLLVQGGATAVSTSATIIGFRSGNGYATVTGANSWLHSSNGILDVGDGGAGTLLLQNSGRASSDTSLLYVGYSSGGVGFASITAGGSLASAGGVIGAAGGVGTVSLSGADSAWENSANLNIGNDGTGNSPANGTGTLNVSASASLSVAGTMRLYNGQISLDNAIVSQTGGAANDLAIGDRGIGTLLVQNGAGINTNSNFIVGYHSGIGRATVSGANSSFNGTGSGILDIGDGATGTLLIQNGGNVSAAGNAYVGFSSGNGFIGVSGTNSQLSIGGTLNLYAGGTLSLASGAIVSVGTLNLNNNTGHFLWTGGTLRINGSAPGSDGALTVPSTATLGGVGSIDRPTNVSAGGTLAPGQSAGKLSFTQNLTLETSGPTHASLEVELGGNPTIPGNAGTTFDQVVVSGSGRVFTVGGASLQVLPLPNVVLNQAYQIVKVTGGATVNFSSAFSNLASGTHYADAHVVYDVSYDTNDGIFVTFTSVPEPGMLGILLTLPLVARRRRISVRQ